MPRVEVFVSFGDTHLCIPLNMQMCMLRPPTRLTNHSFLSYSDTLASCNSAHHWELRCIKYWLHHCPRPRLQSPVLYPSMTHQVHHPLLVCLLRAPEAMHPSWLTLRALGGRALVLSSGESKYGEEVAFKVRPIEALLNTDV